MLEHDARAAGQLDLQQGGRLHPAQRGVQDPPHRQPRADPQRVRQRM